MSRDVYLKHCAFPHPTISIRC